MNGFKNSELKRLYYLLAKIHAFELAIVEHYPEQEMRCPVHLCEGQEAIAAGVCSQLRTTDYLFSTHRNHGHLIAKGCEIGPMFAEIYGRSTGCSGGKGGSMHLASARYCVPGTSAIVAGGIPLAVGTAFASRYLRDGRVSAVFFGDGAVDEGTFYESLNFAALKKLAVVFVCENNFYATNSPQKCRQANCDIHRIGDFFRMAHACIDGNDVLRVYRAAGAAIARCRSGKGPSLIEARTFRIRTHVGPETDLEKGFRSAAEVAFWKAKCPVAAFRKLLIARKIFSPRMLAAVDSAIQSEIARGLEFARSSPFNRSDELLTGVY